MQIYVHARSFFEARQGTRRERKLFRDNRIISINSVSFPSEEPPFSEEFLDADNLLILYFDDVDEGFPNAMTPEQAKQIFPAKKSVAGYSLSAEPWEVRQQN